MNFLILVICCFFFSIGQAKSLLFLGDSLTEGLGVEKEQAYPHLVEQLIIKKLDKKISIINGGVSGSTTGDGLARLKWYLKRKPSIVLLALGANDGLRGLNLDKSKQNLEEIIIYTKKNNAKVLMAGMLIPPNYGPKYTKKFKQMYLDLARKHKIKMLPFLLKDVAGIADLNQKDGIHPNIEGHKVIARNVFEFIKDEI